MPSAQAPLLSHGRFRLYTERLGPLPLVNHFLDRIGLEALLNQHVPTTDRRCTVSHAGALGVLLRSIVVEREPIYRSQETVQEFGPGLYGLSVEQMERLSDDRIGRALDRLFDADRAVLLTEVVVAIGKIFGVRFEELHNDSTSVSFCGQYRNASGKPIRGRRPSSITYGYSKDHRPDLKQLLFTLTTSADGGIPIHFRAYDGNTNDARTHIETWEALRAVAGRTNFLYVADSKLCTRENLDYLDQHGGRFLTVLPRSRLEDGEFRNWVQTPEPTWELVWDRPNPRRRKAPRDRWFVCLSPLPSREAWPVIWVHSALLALRHEHTRRERIAAAIEKLGALRTRLESAKTRLRTASELDARVAQILEKYHVGRYLKVHRTTHEAHRFVQTRRGRPGPDTAYRKITRRRWDIEWSVDEATIAYDRRSDGLYPLLTNDRTLTPAQALEAHKGQPTIEKRFAQTKSVPEIAPVFLKNPGRIEALFTLYFLALLVQALIERELRRAMKRNTIKDLPLYPEERLCKRPTTEQILRLFSLLERHTLFQDGVVVQEFNPELTPLQRQVLALLGAPKQAFTVQKTQ